MMTLIPIPLSRESIKHLNYLENTDLRPVTTLVCRENRRPQTL